jgi:hypothetical protein
LSPNLLNDSRVGISSDKCGRRIGVKESMISQRRVPEKVDGLLLALKRYALYSSRPGRNSSGETIRVFRRVHLRQSYHAGVCRHP